MSLLLFFVGVAGGLAEDAKRVLILNPYGRDVEPFSAAVSSFRSTLAKDLGEPVDFHEIPLELARFAGEGGEEPLVAFLEERIKVQPIDLIVPIGGAGIQFAERHRSRLFPDIPIVVVAAEPRMIPEGFFDNNATLVTESIDLSAMLEDILQMQPETERVAVIFGSSPLEKFWAEQCRQQFQSFSDRLEFVWLNDLPMDQMLSRASKLPPKSFIFHGLYIVDANGIPCEKNQVLRQLNQVANAPVFACFASEFGLGSVGGHLFQNSAIGEQAAHVATRVLKGEPASQIPPKILERAAPSYDWRELKRWNIDEAGLPSNRIISFRAPGFWEQYRWLVVGVIFFSILQAGLIVGLLVNRRKRLRTEAEATLIAHISSRFVNLPAADVDREIIEAQRRICELMGFDLAALWQWSSRSLGSFTATHLYSLEHGPLPAAQMSENDFPWVRSEILAGRVVANRSIDALPAEAKKDKEGARQLGIKSSLTLPLSVGGESPIGILGFNTTKAERSWPPSLIERLQLVAQIVANALARKRADQDLRESKLRQTLAADSAEAGLWELDWRTQNFWLSDKARSIFKFKADDPITMAHFQALVHPADLELVQSSIHQGVTTGNPLELEYRVILDGGLEHWIYSRGRPFFNQAGEPERILGLSMDITSRKDSEERVHQLSHAVEQSPALVVITDTRGKIVYVNRRFTEVTGYTYEESIGRNPRMLKSGDVKPGTYEELWSTVTAGNIWRGEFHNRRKNGDYYWERAAISPLIDGSGTITHYVGIKEDITEAKAAESALHASEELNRLTFEQAAVGIAHIGIDGRWLRVNDRLCKILGHTRDELLSMSYQDLTHPDDVETSLNFETHVLGGSTPPEGLEKRYRIKDGSVVWVSQNLSLVHDEDGDPKFYIALMEDITEQRKAESEVQELSQTLAHTGRVSLLGNLASALAHELSQPLGAILRNAEAAEMMLRTDDPDLEEINAIVKDILRDDQRAGGVIDKLRVLLKRGALELQPVELPAVISEVLSLVQSDALSRKVTINFSIPPKLPLVSGDRIHIQQVMLNLLSNSMDALTGSHTENPTITVSVGMPDRLGAEVRVCDNGPGIPTENLARIFDAFFTTKSTGMGMGLPISKTIIEAQNGKLWAENQPEGGACFCFTLRVAGS